MATAKPTDILPWSSEGITPHTELRSIGWVVGSKPPAQYLNSLYAVPPQYNAFIADRFFSSGTTAQDLHIESGSVLLTSGSFTRISAGTGTSSGGSIRIEPGLRGDVNIGTELPKTGDIAILGGVSRNTVQQQGNVSIDAGQVFIGASTSAGVVVGQNDITLGTVNNAESVLLFPANDTYYDSLAGKSISIVTRDRTTELYLSKTVALSEDDKTPVDVRNKLAGQVNDISVDIVNNNILRLSSLTQDFYVTFDSVPTAQNFGFLENYASPKKEGTYISFNGLTSSGLLGFNFVNGPIQVGTLIAYSGETFGGSFAPYRPSVILPAASDSVPVLTSNKAAALYTVIDRTIVLIVGLNLPSDDLATRITFIAVFPVASYTVPQVINIINQAATSAGVSVPIASTDDGITIKLTGIRSRQQASSIAVILDGGSGTIAANTFGFGADNNYAIARNDESFLGLAQQPFGANQLSPIAQGSQFHIAHLGICFGRVQGGPVPSGTRLGIGNRTGVFLPLGTPLSDPTQTNSCSLYRIKAIALSPVSGDLMRVYIGTVGTSE